MNGTVIDKLFLSIAECVVDELIVLKKLEEKDRVYFVEHMSVRLDKYLRKNEKV